MSSKKSKKSENKADIETTKTKRKKKLTKSILQACIKFEIPSVGSDKIPNGQSETVNSNPGSAKFVDEKVELDDDITWPQKDLAELIKQMDAAIPEKDSLAYSTRVDKLKWDNIAFNEYTGEDCKKMWLLIQKRLRRFRILGELLGDAKEWISKPWTNFYRGNKSKRHPDMPRRPLSSYMLFYLKKKDKVMRENPGIEMTDASKKIAQLYKSVSATKREKYMKLAADERKNYEEKLEDFYRLHPEIPRFQEKSHGKAKLFIETGPKKPQTPFGLYYEGQLKKLDTSTDIDRNAFKEQCKEQWKNMSDKKKVVWINWALDEEAKYHEELKNFMSQNPEFVPCVSKPILTKEEKTIKERIAGKPVKPPNSAYSLFSRMLLQSETIKKVTPKDRMNFISSQWKNCTEEEKTQYRDRAGHLMEQYKLDFASYLESLPEDKRKEELENNLPKRKIKPSETKEPVKKKKVKESDNDVPQKKEEPDIPQKIDEPDVPQKKDEPAVPQKIEEPTTSADFKGEPLQPPMSAYALFCQEYSGSRSNREAWKGLKKEEKKSYDRKVHKMKQIYIREFEKFLKSLTREELTLFSKLRQSRKTNEPVRDDDSCSASSSCCSSSSEN